MSKSLSKHSSMRKSGNSLVVTVPHEIVKETGLEDGDSVFWEIIRSRLFLNIVKLQDIKKGAEEAEAAIAIAEAEEAEEKAAAEAAAAAIAEAAEEALAEPEPAVVGDELVEVEEGAVEESKVA